MDWLCLFDAKVLDTDRCILTAKLNYYGMSSFHFYRWNQLKRIPLPSTLRTRTYEPPKVSLLIIGCVLCTMRYICNHQVVPLTIRMKQMRAIRPISFTIKNSNCAKNNFDYIISSYVPVSCISLQSPSIRLRKYVVKGRGATHLEILALRAVHWDEFLANVNSLSRSLYAIAVRSVRLSSVCLLRSCNLLSRLKFSAIFLRRLVR